MFDDLLLLTVAAAPQPWDAAEVEAAVDALFADAGLEPDFVDGRVKTDWLESLRAEFLEGTRLT